ncbi:hypothetical protein M0R45_013666 [Rubus argutus]|uniref:Uncharacterized protein n=1 Tax=Rubus argutus TaxID=59490 RepID=A0AAW1XKE4_RUBAR
MVVGKRADEGGTKGEKPNLGTSPLHKLPCYTDKCLVCSLVDDHPTSSCPYLNFLPEDAIVSSGTEIICKFCGEWNGSWSCCKVQGRAVLKSCALCAKCGDHRSRMCPRRVAPCFRLPESPHQASSRQLH